MTEHATTALTAMIHAVTTLVLMPSAATSPSDDTGTDDTPAAPAASGRTARASKRTDSMLMVFLMVFPPGVN